MPIKNLSDQLRMPRLGKIHLGFRDEKKRGAPSATDYFVCPPEVKAVFGEQPKSLPIYIPTEDAEYWASQYYRAYSQTRGLICRGDGETCSRMIDVATGVLAGKAAVKVAWQDGTCAGRECPLYKEKKCGEMMCLQFMLPDVPGVGVWQIDTGSINSIRNINSEATLIRQICGKINMIPLLLTLESGELNNPDTGKKQMHYFLHLRERETLHKLLDDSRKPLYELLAPPVADLEEAARDIDALWPEDKPPAQRTTISEKQQPEGIEEKAGSQAPELDKNAVTAGAQPLIDLSWLKESLTKTHWTTNSVISWLKSKANYQGMDFTGSLSEVVFRMDKAQAAFLVAEIEDRLQMA